MKRSAPAVQQRVQNVQGRPSGTIDNSAFLDLLGEGSRPVRAGMPSGLRKRMEALTGVSLAGVEVRKDSVEAERLSTPAFTNGNTVYLAHGQERELPHELGHVADMRLGGAPSTRTEHGVKISRDAPREARMDCIAQLALQGGQSDTSPATPVLQPQAPPPPSAGIIQMCPRGKQSVQAIGTAVDALFGTAGPDSTSPQKRYDTRPHPRIDFSKFGDSKDDPKDTSYGKPIRSLVFKEFPKKQRDESLNEHMKKGGFCQYEKCPYKDIPLEVGKDANPRFKASLDHIKPVSEIYNEATDKSMDNITKLANDPLNLQWTHACCNSSKSGVHYKYKGNYC